MGISDTKLCKICHQDTDTIKHAFLERHITTNLWFQVENWAKKNISKSIKFTDIDTIFGYQCKKKLINKMIMNRKLVIYCNRKSERKYHINMMKRVLYHELCTEEYEPKTTQKEQECWVK